MYISPVILLIAACAVAGAPFSGEISIDGKTSKIIDAIAYADAGDANANTHVMLSAAAFDRVAFARDGRIDSGDIERHFLSTDANGIELVIPAKGNKFQANFWKGFSQNGTQISTDLKVTARTAQRITGTLNFAYQGNVAKVSFDLPVTSKLKLTSTPLPHDMGEPGKVLTAYLEARARDDGAAMEALTQADQAKLLANDGALAKEFNGIDLFRTTTACRKLTTLDSGNLFREEALVDYTCAGATRPRKETIRGTALLLRSAGTWRVAGFGREKLYTDEDPLK